MRKIEIDDEVYQTLLKNVKSFEDTPNAVLRRLLGLDELNPYQQDPERLIREEKDYGRDLKEMMASLGLEENLSDKYKKIRRGEKTSQREYRIPILEALVELGGRALSSKVLEKVEIKMKTVLKSVDYEDIPSGHDVRWRNTARWERKNMVQEGLLRSDSPIGVWEISEKGREYLNLKKSKNIL